LIALTAALPDPAIECGAFAARPLGTRDTDGWTGRSRADVAVLPPVSAPSPPRRPGSGRGAREQRGRAYEQQRREVEEAPDVWALHVSETREMKRARAILSIRIYDPTNTSAGGPWMLSGVHNGIFQTSAKL
jgi:hypothetical protein